MKKRRKIKKCCVQKKKVSILKRRQRRIDELSNVSKKEITNDMTNQICLLPTDILSVICFEYLNLIVRHTFRFSCQYLHDFVHSISLSKFISESMFDFKCQHWGELNLFVLFVLKTGNTFLLNWKV
jgi:hypothetical protein